MIDDGNLVGERADEIKERIIFYLKRFEETDLEDYKNQYLLHVEYWGGVLQKIKQQNSSSFLFFS